MATYWTLQYGATERSFQNWGFTDPLMFPASQGLTRFTVRVPGVSNLILSPPVPFEGAVIIRRNRTSADGSDNSFGDGAIVFQGKQITRRGNASPTAPADVLTFGDAWYDLANTVFQQRWTFKSAGVAIASRWFSRVNLFQSYTGYSVTAAAQSGANVNITLGSAFTATVGNGVAFVSVNGLSVNKVVTVTDSTHFAVAGTLSGAYAGGGTMYPGALLNNGQQMQQILNYAITTCGVNLQIGTIDPAFNLNIYPVRAMMCSAALILCLQPTPDAVTWIDYTTTPPTFNCRQRANLTQKTLAYADNGATHESSEITPRYDLQPSAVVLQYQKTNVETVGGSTSQFTDFYSDAYNAGGAIVDQTLADAAGNALRALVCAIDLRGSRLNDMVVTVKAQAFDPTALGWWSFKKPEVKVLNTAPNSIAYVASSVKVIGDDGTDYTAGVLAGTYNELLSGSVAPWMGVGSAEVTVTAGFTYTQYDASTRQVHKVTAANPHSFSTRIKITTSAPGAINYYALQSYDPGESAPAGLAQSIWSALSVLQYEGTHSIVETDGSGKPGVSDIIGPWYSLNLTGGQTAWATMKATIQGSVIDFFRGRTQITIGVARHIAPGDLEQLLQFLRFRTVYDNPNLQLSGQQNANATQGGGDTAAENTTHGTPVQALHTVSALQGDGTSSFLQHDATNDQLFMQRLTTGGVQTLTVAGAMKLRTTDVVFADQTPIGQVQEQQTLHYLDRSGAAKRSIIPTTPPIADISSDPSTDPDGLWLGGSGGSVKLHRLKSVQGDYITCRTFDGTTEGSTDIHIAKHYKWRNSIAAATLQNVAHTYTYASSTDSNGIDNVVRTNNWSGLTENEQLFPAWELNELITVATSDHTGVSVSGVELTLIYHGSPRQWGKI